MVPWNNIIGDVVGIVIGLSMVMFNDSYARQVAATRQPFMSTDYSKYIPRVKLLGKIGGSLLALVATIDLVVTLYKAMK